MENGDRRYYDAEIRNLAQDIVELKQFKTSCQEEVFERLRTLENQMATLMAATPKGAIIIGACSLTGTLLAVLITKLI